jgi:hypothetical protein
MLGVAHPNIPRKLYRSVFRLKRHRLPEHALGNEALFTAPLAEQFLCLGLLPQREQWAEVDQFVSRCRIAIAIRRRTTQIDNPNRVNRKKR